MTENRLQRVEHLASEAAERTGRDRGVYLEKECGDDTELLIMCRTVAARLDEEATRRPRTGDFTRIMHDAHGNDAAYDRFWAIVYDDLRRLAHRVRSREPRPDLPHTSSLANGAFEKLAGSVDWENRRHFFAAAARAMRQIIVDSIRKKRPIDGLLLRQLRSRFGSKDVSPDDIHRLIDDLAKVRRRPAEVVRFRVYSGMNVAEIAYALDVCERTVKSDWQFARAWLHRELSRLELGAATTAR